MINQNLQLWNALKAEVHRRLLLESVPRIEKCFALLSEEEIWERPNDELTSVGNLVLHLCGNVEQWITSGLGGKADARNRKYEFSTVDNKPKRELLNQLIQTLDEALLALEGMSEEDLMENKNVQGFQESGLSILIHVVEHFSYHVGQISYFTKLKHNKDLAYYANINLDKNN